MKSKIISAVLLGCAVCAFADSSMTTNMSVWSVSGTTSSTGTVTQNTNTTATGNTATNAVNMSLLALPNQSPKVVINLTTPGVLTVYDQNGKVAFTSNLPAGQVMVDTSNFPLGNDKLVVTTNQNGSTFTMVQNVIVYSNNTASVSGS